MIRYTMAAAAAACLLAPTFATPAFAQQPTVSAEEQAILDEEARLEAEEATADASENASDPTAPNPAPTFPELRPVLEEINQRKHSHTVNPLILARGTFAPVSLDPAPNSLAPHAGASVVRPIR